MLLVPSSKPLPQLFGFLPPPPQTKLYLDFDANVVERILEEIVQKTFFCVQLQLWIKIAQRRKYNNNNIPCLKKIVFKAVQHNSVHNSVILIENQLIWNTMIFPY